MAKIRYKTRSLIRRFGPDPVVVSKALAKQYIDRGQAVAVKKSIVKKKEPVEEEETIKIKIKKNKKKE